MQPWYLLITRSVAKVVNPILHGLIDQRILRGSRGKLFASKLNHNMLKSKWLWHKNVTWRHVKMSQKMPRFWKVTFANCPLPSQFQIFRGYLWKKLLKVKLLIWNLKLFSKRFYLEKTNEVAILLFSPTKKNTINLYFIRHNTKYSVTGQVTLRKSISTLTFLF